MQSFLLIFIKGAINFGPDYVLFRLSWQPRRSINKTLIKAVCHHWAHRQIYWTIKAQFSIVTKPELPHSHHLFMSHVCHICIFIRLPPWPTHSWYWPDRLKDQGRYVFLLIVIVGCVCICWLPAYVWDGDRPVWTFPLCFFRASLLLNLFPQLSALQMNLASPLHASLCWS